MLTIRRVLLALSLLSIPVLLLAMMFLLEDQTAVVNVWVAVLTILAGVNALWVLHRDWRAEQNAKELGTIYEIAQSITESSINPDETLQTILDMVKRIVPYNGGEICLYEPENNGLRVRAWQGTFGEDSRGRLYKLGEGFTGGMAQTRTSMLVPDIMQHETIRAVHRELGRGAIVRSFIGVPLLSRNKLVGTLELVSAEPNKFNENTRRLLETIAPQAAVAIQNARQVQAREQQLKAQIQQLQIEIDQARRSSQVKEITDTTYFRDLKAKARRLSESDEDKED